MSGNTTVQSGLINLTINGSPVSVPKGSTVYQAAKTIGIDIPIFCYHDRMPPFGACRMCLVEVEKMGKLQASCTLEVSEGMVVKTQSPNAIDGRKQILEFLLINHPLDCPICDRGGECPLQDQTLEHGPGESRFYESKRHFQKALPLGPVLMLDRERCIVCARCTRFGEINAGDHSLQFIERGYRTEVGTPDGGPAESKFIGNTIMICPVGALTSQVYRFRARPWDNKPTESACTLCPVGCSMILDSRDGEIVRTRSKENKDLNDIWLCDKGWFGYEFTSHPNRLKQPLIRKEGKLEEASWEEALSLIAAKIKEYKSTGQLAAFGGNPLTFEENYLYQKLMRTVAGVDHVDHRIGIGSFCLQTEGVVPGMEMSIGSCEELSYAVLLGLDLTEEFPVVWLRLKQAINRGASVSFLGHYAPEIGKHLNSTKLHPPGKELETMKAELPTMLSMASENTKGAIFIGRQYLSSPLRGAILTELFKLKSNNPNLSLNIMEGSGNSIGAYLAGMRPDHGPFGEHLKKSGLNATQVMEQSASEGWGFLYVAGANPAREFSSKLWKGARSKLGFLVVQDLFMTETAKDADVVLPTLGFVEKEGSFINIEGRVQKLKTGKEIPKGIYSDGDIFVAIASKLSMPLVIDPWIKDFLLRPSVQLRPKDKAMLSSHPSTPFTVPQGSLAATFAPSLFDNGVRMEHNPNVLKLAKQPAVRIHSSEGAKRKILDGDKVRLKAKGNAINAKVEFDDTVAEGTIVIPIGMNGLKVSELGVNGLNGAPIELGRE